ncbi:hypothetical protein [uncultured Methylobacterium sp.]|uniref:hypothetical protein n=1 Tax=uncultured Methylobacterium sp. TaxID=157278 RepID=UPI0035C9C7BF
MQSLSADPASPPAATDADRLRARLNRVVPVAVDLDRPRHDEAPPRRRQPATAGGRGFRLGWVGWLAIECAAAVLILGAVIAWPPVEACRDQERKTGFYTGDSLNKCIRRGIAARIDWADQRLKMAIRGSGR